MAIEKYDEMMDDLIDMNREVVMLAHVWKFDKLRRQFYFNDTVSGERINVCYEWEYVPVTESEDALDALITYTQRNGCRFRIERNPEPAEDTFEWEIEIGGNSKNYAIESSLMFGFAVSEAILKAEGIDIY